MSKLKPPNPKYEPRTFESPSMVIQDSKIKRRNKIQSTADLFKSSGASSDAKR
jgi:hypothetical protein